jgi:hypothetical protein
MILEGIDSHAGKTDSAKASFGFGAAHDSTGASYFGRGSADPHRAVNKINVSAGKGEKFAGAEPAKPGQDDQCSQSRANRAGQLENGFGIDIGESVGRR